MDAYVRVSRVGERSGDEYKSPAIQEQAIRQWAKLNDVEIGKVLPDEDVSGAKAVKDRKLEQLIRRAEEGQTRGVVVYRIDRFGRDVIETLTATKRLTAVGARLVSVADGFDSSQPSSKLVLTIMSGLAEQYLDGIRDGWARSTAAAVSEGKHVASKAPLGYLRQDQATPTYDDK